MTRSPDNRNRGPDARQQAGAIAAREAADRFMARMSDQDRTLIATLESSIYPGARAESIWMVVQYCRVAGLDPLQKPVHIVPMSVKVAGTRDEYRWVDVVMPGIGLYRTNAARTGEYLGKTEPEFGPTVEENLGGMLVRYPEWCRITIRRQTAHGVAEFTAREYWIENYATKDRDSDAPNKMWRRRPFAQLAKCVEAQALRAAFPEACGTQPTFDELEGKQIEPAMAAQVIEQQSVDDGGLSAELARKIDALRRAEAAPAQQKAHPDPDPAKRATAPEGGPSVAALEAAILTIDQPTRGTAVNQMIADSNLAPEAKARLRAAVNARVREISQRMLQETADAAGRALDEMVDDITAGSEGANATNSNSPE